MTLPNTILPTLQEAADNINQDANENQKALREMFFSKSRIMLNSFQKDINEFTITFNHYKELAEDRKKFFSFNRKFKIDEKSFKEKTNELKHLMISFSEKLVAYQIVHEEIFKILEQHNEAKLQDATDKEKQINNANKKVMLHWNELLNQTKIEAHKIKIVSESYFKLIENNLIADKILSEPISKFDTAAIEEIRKQFNDKNEKLNTIINQPKN